MITVEELQHKMEIQYGYEAGRGDCVDWDEGARSIVVLHGILRPDRRKEFFIGMHTTLSLILDEDTNNQQTVDWNEAG